MYRHLRSEDRRTLPTTQLSGSVSPTGRIQGVLRVSQRSVWPGRLHADAARRSRSRSAPFPRQVQVVDDGRETGHKHNASQQNRTSASRLILKTFSGITSLVLLIYMCYDFNFTLTHVLFVFVCCCSCIIVVYQRKIWRLRKQLKTLGCFTFIGHTYCEVNFLIVCIWWRRGGVISVSFRHYRDKIAFYGRKMANPHLILVEGLYVYVAFLL